MEIRKAIPSDLVEILYLLRVCVKDMNEHGMKQWNSAHPEVKVIRKNLDEGFIYLLKDQWVCKGMVTLTPEIPVDHEDLNFSGSGRNILYLQWMAVHPYWQGQGIAKMLLDFAENYARKNKYEMIQIDVFSDHDLGQQICHKNEFTEVGKFHSTFQKIPFICYEKRIK
jgi:ribosomal protein S18 acetylase RimI-like enzyme